MGGNDANCKGTAWFSDFKLEKGYKNDSNEWQFACFIIKNTDVTLKDTNKKVKVSMTNNEVFTIKQDMQRFKSSCEGLSQGKIRADYDIFEIDTPLTSISNDEDNGNYVAGSNVASIINPYLVEKEYDHIFIVIKLGDVKKNMDIPVNDWIGLGGMEYKGIGFSNIRIPSDNSQIYTYTRYNTFPEEVIVHEFLHDLERISKALGYNIPALHDSEKHGYKPNATTGLKDWYQAYMRKTILDKSTNTYIGLPAEVYTTKPVHSREFKYSVDLEYNSEPKNIFEEILKIIEEAKNTFTEIYVEGSENAI